jgi:hypothetical protein
MDDEAGTIRIVDYPTGDVGKSEEGDENVTGSESKSRSALNNRDTAKRVEEYWSRDLPIGCLNDEDGPGIDPEVLADIVERVERIARAEVEYEERFHANLPPDLQTKNFMSYMMRIDIEKQIGWATPDVLEEWRKSAKRAGEICGVCFRAFSDDETIYIDRTRELYSDEAPAPNVLYGPVCASCVTRRFMRCADEARKTGRRAGFTWDDTDDYLGIRKKTTIFATPADCETCGRHMFVRSSNTGRYFRIAQEHYFCSGRCKSRFYNKQRSEKTAKKRSGKECPMCGREFTAKRSDAKTCTPACRQKMHRMWKSLEA